MPVRFVRAAWQHRKSDGLWATLLRGFLGVGAVRLLAKPLTILVAIALARWLGPEGFGHYSFATAVLMILALPISDGLKNLTTREVAASTKGGDWATFRGLLRRMHLWVLGGSVVIIALTSLVIAALPTDVGQGRQQLILIGLGALPFIGLTAVYSASLRGLGHVILASVAGQILRPGVALAIIATTVLVAELTPSFAMVARLVSGMAVVAILIAVLRARQPASVWRGPAAYRDRAWAAAWGPFALLAASTLMNIQLAVLLLGWLGTAEQVAAMRVAERAAMLVLVPLQVLNYVMGPRITRLYQDGDWHRLARMARFSARAGLLVGLVPALICGFAAKPLVPIVLGEAYRGLVAGPLTVLAFGQLVNAGVGSVGLLLNMTEFERDSVMGQLVGLGVHLVVGVSLIPALGALGAALAAAASIITWNLLLAVRVYRQLGLRPGPL